MKDEEVMVVERGRLADMVDHKNYNLIWKKKESVFDFILKNYTFMKRETAEYNFDFKQIIPYIIVNFQDNYLLLKRTKKQTEKRLHDKYSLGIGGHINPSVSDGYENIIMEGLYKELNEEIYCEDMEKFVFAGILNDESTDVSRVHLGLVFIASLKSPGFKILEPDKMTGDWKNKEELADYYEGFESWSKIIFDQFINSA